MMFCFLASCNPIERSAGLSDEAPHDAENLGSQRSTFGVGGGVGRGRGGGGRGSRGEEGGVGGGRGG